MTYDLVPLRATEKKFQVDLSLMSSSRLGRWRLSIGDADRRPGVASRRPLGCAYDDDVAGFLYH